MAEHPTKEAEVLEQWLRQGLIIAPSQEPPSGIAALLRTATWNATFGYIDPSL
jgi:hypothetical protein